MPRSGRWVNQRQWSGEQPADVGWLACRIVGSMVRGLGGFFWQKLAAFSKC